MTISIKSPTSTTGSIQKNGSDVITIDASDNVTVANDLTATSFTGDGSQLTNLPASGKILQVLQETLTTAFTTTSNTYVDLLTVTITPSATDSKVYVSFTTNAGTNGDVAHLYTSLFRDSTEIGSATSTDSRTGAQTVTNTSTGQQMNYAGALLDSPSSTSAITYKLRVQVGGAQTGYWNRSARDNNLATYDGRTVTQITVMEVAA